MASVFLSTLSPKFYVALTGTSSLISGLILIFEWWYFRKYGTSFIEQLSLNHLSPWLGLLTGGDSDTSCGQDSGGSASPSSSIDGATAAQQLCHMGDVSGAHLTASTSSALSSHAPTECKTWINPLSLFRGCEYYRYARVRKQDPLSYCDMNLSAQDHQKLFTCSLLAYTSSSGSTACTATATISAISSSTDTAMFSSSTCTTLASCRNNSPPDGSTTTTTTSHTDTSKQLQQQQEDYEKLMQLAWRERDTQTRLMLASRAVKLHSDCAPALLLLAEEQSATLDETETALRRALRAAETSYRKSLIYKDSTCPLAALTHRRDLHVLIYVRRRLAMCIRRLGRPRDAAKMFRELIKETPIWLAAHFNMHENLLEALLEAQAYSEAQTVLSKYDDISLPKSATICYTAALLKARLVSEKFSAESASRRGLSGAELNAVQAIHRAVEFNPHVPEYLLELCVLCLPPEHVQKRGDSEAIAYAFSHLRHWKRITGALSLLHCTWQGTFRAIPYPLEKGHLFFPYPASTEFADRELLPSFHRVSVFPRKELPFFVLFTGALCSCTAVLALLTHQFPETTGSVIKLVFGWLSAPLMYVVSRLQALLPCNLLRHLSKI